MVAPCKYNLSSAWKTDTMVDMVILHVSSSHRNFFCSRGQTATPIYADSNSGSMFIDMACGVSIELKGKASCTLDDDPILGHALASKRDT